MWHFNQSMTELISEIIRVLPEFERIRLDQLLVGASFNHKRTRAGLLAYVVPLKYKDGSPVEMRIKGTRAYHYGMLPMYKDGREVLYIIYFVLPRFMNQSFSDKLDTVIHELYHIHPDFNGDFRRLKGRSYLHGKSIKDYDERIRQLTQKFLNSEHDAGSYSFLKHSYGFIEKKFGGIVAKRILEPKPRLLKIATVGSPSKNRISTSGIQPTLPGI